MVYHLLLGLLGSAGLFAGWVAVERLAHRQTAARQSPRGAPDAPGTPGAPTAARLDAGPPAAACSCCAVPCGVRPAGAPARPDGALLAFPSHPTPAGGPPAGHRRS